jgi:hypothetical protein
MLCVERLNRLASRGEHVLLERRANAEALPLE